MNPDADQFARVDVQGQGLFAKDFLDNMAGQSERLDLPGRRPPPHPLAHQDTPHGTADALLNGVLGATDEVRHDHAMTYARVGQRCEGLVGAGPEQAPPAATGWRDLAGVLHVLLPYYETKSETAIISFTRKRAGQLCGRGNSGCYHDDTASFLRCIWTNKSWRRWPVGPTCRPYTGGSPCRNPGNGVCIRRATPCSTPNPVARPSPARRSSLS